MVHNLSLFSLREWFDESKQSLIIAGILKVSFSSICKLVQTSQVFAEWILRENSILAASLVISMLL